MTLKLVCILWFVCLQCCYVFGSQIPNFSQNVWLLSCIFMYLWQRGKVKFHRGAGRGGGGGGGCGEKCLFSPTSLTSLAYFNWWLDKLSPALSTKMHFLMRFLYCNLIQRQPYTQMTQGRMGGDLWWVTNTSREGGKGGSATPSFF